MEWGCGFGRGAAAALRGAAGWVSFGGFGGWGLGLAMVVGFCWPGGMVPWGSFEVFCSSILQNKFDILSNRDVEMSRDRIICCIPGGLGPLGSSGFRGRCGIRVPLAGLFWMVPGLRCSAGWWFYGWGRSCSVWFSLVL